MAGIQCKLANNTDALSYGSSISNQAIENFRFRFKRIYLSSWTIDFFKDFAATGNLILGNIVPSGMSVVCFFTSDSMRTRQIHQRMERTKK